MIKKLIKIFLKPSLVVLYLIDKLSPLIKNDEFYIKLKFWINMGYWLNLNSPKTFNEKLQWLKLYDRNPEYSIMVDKYAVKQYVAERIGEKYIIPTLGVWNSPDDIDFSSLPNQFVLKCTHDSGGLCICKDKSKFDIEYSKKRLRKSLKHNYYYLNREWPYKYVVKRIIAEKLLVSKGIDAPNDLPDYKFYCFNGEPRYCQVIRDRNSKESIDFYDMDWVLQEFVGLNPVARNGLIPVARPKQLSVMVDICRKLAKGILFVRIDLYVVDKRVYFGEITFYPAGGIGVFTPGKWNKILGDMIDIEGCNMGV